MGFPSGSLGKGLAYSAGVPGSIPGLGRSPGERKWQPTPVLLPGKSHGQRILVGYSPWDRKESDMTEQLHFTLDWVVRKGLFELTAGLRSKCQGASHAGMREEK